VVGLDLEAGEGLRDAELLRVEGCDRGGVRGRGVRGERLGVVGLDGCERAGELYLHNR